MKQSAPKKTKTVKAWAIESGRGSLVPTAFEKTPLLFRSKTEASRYSFLRRESVVRVTLTYEVPPSKSKKGKGAGK